LPHATFWIQRDHRTENLGLLVIEVIRARTDRRFHRDDGEYLQQMILHDVAQCADCVVEPATVLDAEVFGHGDVNLGNTVAVPQRGQRLVGEPQALQLDDRLLAQKVVDAQDLVFIEHRTQPGIEFTR
jgi:hypothetical protein